MAILWPWLDLWFWVAFVLINLVFAFIILFIDQKEPSVTSMWLLVLLFMPVVGFVIYLFFGRTLSREKMFHLKAERDEQLKRRTDTQVQTLQGGQVPTEDEGRKRFMDMAHMLLLLDRSVITNNNEIKVYASGNEKFDDLVEEIERAEEHIHIEYYIFRDDELGHRVVSALAKKAKEGVEVRVLYDGAGCKGLPKDYFKEIEDAGGRTSGFFQTGGQTITRLNFRNHRKIAVLDGTTAFVGGYNIGDEYLGKGPLGDWRDAAVRIRGEAAKGAQLRFFLDWNHETKELEEFDMKYFPETEPSDGIPVQIVSSGPDSHWGHIKYAYIKMINLAKDFVYIQTPYFIPDKAILDALQMAALSGVDVRIMIPCKPDHPFIYWAGLWHIGQLLDSGVRAFTFDDGFIHAKTIVVDGLAGSIGSANWDNRSFHLNFETNAFMYDREVGMKMKELFEKDLERCSEITPEVYAQRSRTVKVKEAIFRLGSGIA